MTSAILVYNPAAGQFALSRRRLQILLESLLQHGIQAKAVASRPADLSPRSLDLTGFELLVVYGGDGTLHHVIGDAVRYGVPVALLPAGTENVLARELGIPMDPERAVAVAARRKLQKLHLGTSNGRFFHLMTGIGLDGDVISRLREPWKRRVGPGAYWVAGLASLFKYQFPRFTVHLDGACHEATFAVIANARGYGGQLQITPRASLGDDHLDVCLFTSRSSFRYMYYLLGVLSGQHIHYPDVVYRKVTRLEIDAHESVPVQMDGEQVSGGRMEFNVSDVGLEVVVP